MFGQNVEFYSRKNEKEVTSYLKNAFKPQNIDADMILKSRFRTSQYGKRFFKMQILKFDFSVNL